VTRKRHTLPGIPTDQPAAQPRPRDSSHVVAPTTGFNPTRPANPSDASQPRRVKKPSEPATLMEFLAPSTHEPERVHKSPGCHTGYVPSSGFLTLSTAYSSLERSALFHADNAHGVPLFRGFPPLSGPMTRRHRITLLAFLHDLCNALYRKRQKTVL